MIPRLSTSLSGLGAAIVASWLVAVPSALADGPFAALGGNWSGNGTITMGTGATEPIRCRVKYDVESNGSSLTQDLRCASDSYKFELTSNVEHRNGAVSGFWTEKTRNTGGKLMGKATGDHIQATVETPGFIATLLVTTKGNRQSVTIKSPSTDIREITIALRK